MLIRTLLLAIFLISSALSVWAAEPVPTPTSSSKVASDQAMTMDEALKHVTVSAEDWLDGNTYYIRYTFTNPTDVAIDKKVDLTTVLYERCSMKTSFETRHQCNDTISQLIIPPYGTFETTLAFPQTGSADFNRHMYSKFFFDDASHIDYNESYLNRESSLFAVSLVVSPQNKAQLSIRNRSFFETITQIDRVSVYFSNLHNCEIISTYSDPFSIMIPPRQSALIPLYQLPPQLLDENMNNIDEDDKMFFDILHIPMGILVSAEMNINNILHQYRGFLSIDAPHIILKEKTDALPGITDYSPAYCYPDTTSGSYRLDDSYLYTYFPLINPNDTSLFIPSAKYDINIDYFDYHNNFQPVKITFDLPLDITLEPHTTQYFSIKIPLPDDFKKIQPNDNLYLYSSSHSNPDSIQSTQDLNRLPDPHFIFLYPIEKLPLPISEDEYRPLDIVAEYQSLYFRVK